jgi:hypothetical protein
VQYHIYGVAKSARVCDKEIFFILLQVSNKVKRIQTLKVALAYRIVNKCTRMNMILINENAILAISITEYLN